MSETEELFSDEESCVAPSIASSNRWMIKRTEEVVVVCKNKIS